MTPRSRKLDTCKLSLHAAVTLLAVLFRPLRRCCGTYSLPSFPKSETRPHHTLAQSSLFACLLPVSTALWPLACNRPLPISPDQRSRFWRGAKAKKHRPMQVSQRLPGNTSYDPLTLGSSLRTSNFPDRIAARLTGVCAGGTFRLFHPFSFSSSPCPNYFSPLLPPHPARQVASQSASH